MHFRLRNRASLLHLLSFCSIVIWVISAKWLFNKYKELTAEPHPIAENASEVFIRMSGDQNFEIVFTNVLLVLILTFCISFILSAKSIPCLTTQSRGPP